MQKKELAICTQNGGIFSVATNDREYLENEFARLKECGFEAIDYGINGFVRGKFVTLGEIDDFWEKDLEELYEYFEPTKTVASKYGISFAQSHAVFPFYVEGRDKINEYLIMSIEKNIAICNYLECPMIVVHSHRSNESEDKDFEISMELYKKLIPAAKKYGIKICLENGFRVWENRGLDGGQCSSAEEALRYINALNDFAGEDIFGFCLDTGHANVLKKDIKAYIKKLGKYLYCLHIHDNYEMFDAHLIPYTQLCPGFGRSVDWNDFIEGLREINYRGALSFETFKGVSLFPGELKNDVLKLLSAIGRYFRDRILEEK